MKERMAREKKQRMLCAKRRKKGDLRQLACNAVFPHGCSETYTN
jgi:hypothetical protein